MSGGIGIRRLVESDNLTQVRLPKRDKADMLAYIERVLNSRMETVFETRNRCARRSGSGGKAPPITDVPKVSVLQ